MAQAKRIEAVSVNQSYRLDSDFWLEVSFDGGYDAFAALPKALEYEDRKYGQTGWDSDKNLAFYCTSKKFAVPA